MIRLYYRNKFCSNRWFKNKNRFFKQCCSIWAYY
jgi:hypothetical protein